jgi:hypothetical protein
MGKNWIAVSFSMLFFVIGFLILLEQYLSIGIWLQLRDIHHETLAMSSFALAVGVLIGSNLARNEKGFGFSS